METRFEALSNLFKDAEVAQKLMSCTSEEAVAVLKDQYQLEFTVEELNDVAAGIKAALAESDELSSDQLDEVVGGGKGSGAYNAGYYIGKTVKVVGTAAGIAGFLIAAGVVSW